MQEAFAASLLAVLIGLSTGLFDAPDILSPVTNSEHHRFAVIPNPLQLKDVVIENRETKELAQGSLWERQSGPYQHVLGHANCPACIASEEDATMKSAVPPVFEQAAAAWLTHRRADIAPRTIIDYEQSIRSLTVFLAGTLLTNITIGTVNEYKRVRSEKAGPSRVNHDMIVLSMIMRFAAPRQWKKIKPYYKPMRLPRRRIGKAITREQEEHLFQTAKNGPKRWKVAYWASSLMANTGAGPGEIRHLRLCDINLQQRYIDIQDGTKNNDRVRRVPLNDMAARMLDHLMRRAEDLGWKEETDYLLPHRAHVKGAGWDFKKPVGTWRKAWEKLRVAAGMPTLRMYDLRHHAITRMLENPGISIETVKAVVGHSAVSKVTEQVYSHIRNQAKFDAVMVLDPKKAASVEIMPVKKKLSS